jgi:ribosomal protein S18 acetylase RimI-like enzyme
MNVKIRQATADDSKGLARVQVDSYRSVYAGILPQAYLSHFSYEEQEQDWVDLLTIGMEDVLLVAENAAGDIVGYALGSPGARELLSYDSELVSLHVCRSAQGQGIGCKLITAVAEVLKQAVCTSLIVWVLEDNPARSLYERLGGRLLGQKAWDGSEEFAVSVHEVAYGWSNIDDLM